MDQYKDFELYSRALIESKDCDPVYPFIKDIIKEYNFQPEWAVFIYVAFYNLESMIRMCERMPTVNEWNPKLFKALRLSGKLRKFGHERRGTQRIIENQINMFDNIICFIDWFEDLEGNAMDFRITNEDFRKEIERLPNHGSWTAYKLAELFEKSLGRKYLEILDLGIDDKDFSRNDGPLGGLRHLFDPTPDRSTKFDKTYWLPIFNKFGEELSKGWGVDMGEVETCLCKWHKMKTGNYWVGHDIAEFIELEEVMGAERYQKLMSKNFDERFWYHYKGFPKHLKNIYKETGSIVQSDFAKRLPKIDVMQIIQDL
jgi:hypothetical protein